MVRSSSISITPAQHADSHRVGGSDPLTGEVGIDRFTDFTETQAFNGTSPTSFTDLDISAIVGAAERIVGVRINNPSALNYFWVRKNGDTKNPYLADAAAGISVGRADTNQSTYLEVATDAAGLIEWKAENASTTDIDVLYWM